MELSMFESETWIPPSRSGLSNSEPIIPSYYLKKFEFFFNNKIYEAKFIDMDYLSIIKDDIRNMRKLNKYQLSFIKHNLSDEDKNEIIELMNMCIENIGSLIMDS
jgi:hypothetical protein